VTGSCDRITRHVKGRPAVRKSLSLAVLGLTLVAALTGPSSAFAASPHQVDPATMVPALNPDFGPWVCTDTGSGPICRGHVFDSWTNADSGLSCGDRPIFTTGAFASDSVRWHLPDGRAVHTFFKNADGETWTLSSTGTGPSVQVHGSWNEHYVYPIPGDRSTRVLTITGSDWQVTAGGYGVVFHDVGLVRFQPGIEGDIDLTHGPTDSDHGDLDLVLPAVCAVLTG